MQHLANFSGDCGRCLGRGAYHSGHCPQGLRPGQEAMLNGKGLDQCVLGCDGAAVSHIHLRRQPGPYAYHLLIEACGPSAAANGSFRLALQDQAGNVFHLCIYVAIRCWHEISYNSLYPCITDICWSDSDFLFNSRNAAAAKPLYKVVSPVSLNDTEWR